DQDHGRQLREPELPHPADRVDPPDHRHLLAAPRSERRDLPAAVHRPGSDGMPDAVSGVRQPRGRVPGDLRQRRRAERLLRRHLPRAELQRRKRVHHRQLLAHQRLHEHADHGLHDHHHVDDDPHDDHDDPHDDHHDDPDEHDDSVDDHDHREHDDHHGCHHDHHGRHHHVHDDHDDRHHHDVDDDHHHEHDHHLDDDQHDQHVHDVDEQHDDHDCDHDDHHVGGPVRRRRHGMCPRHEESPQVRRLDRQGRRQGDPCGDQVSPEAGRRRLRHAQREGDDLRRGAL